MRRVLKRLLVIMAAVCITVGSMPAGIAFAAQENSTVESILSSMTTRQKIEQCLMVDFRKWDSGSGSASDMTVLDTDVADILSEYQFGSVILFAENIKKTANTVALTRDMQTAATAGGGLPLMIAADQEGGLVYRLGSGTALPGNMALAATGDTKNAELAGEVIASELDAVGINTTLAPVIDVNNEAGNSVIGVRSFSDDAAAVGEYGSSFIRGLEKFNIIGCAKHYPGHGDTNVDSHTGLPEVNKSREEIEANELVPYKKTIKQGVDMIMTAHILYPALDSSTIYSEKTKQEERRPATLSHAILTDLLRGELGFDGVVVTDAMNMAGIAKRFSREQSTLEALKAGADMVCMPVTGIYTKEEWTEAMDSVLDTVETAVNSGGFSEKDLDDSVRRILTLKNKRGILAYNADNYTADRALKVVGSAYNRNVEREISAKAVTVIRNENNTLPLITSKSTKVLMLAPYDNETAQMVMGFNRAKAAGLVAMDTEVRVERFSKSSCEVSGRIKQLIDWADVVLINSEVVDSEDMSYGYFTSVGPKNFTEYCRQNGKKSVVMSVRNPYDVQLYPDADAVLAAYCCKGSSADVTAKLLEGAVIDDAAAFGPNIVAGVEVAFGVFGAQGRLPVTVPVFDAEKGGYTDTVAYARGYGLTYDPLTKAPSKAKISSVKAGKKKIRVTMSSAPAAKKGTHYQIAYRLKGSKKWHYKSTAKSSLTLTGLKTGKRYFIKVRSCRAVGDTKICSKWTKRAKSMKVR